jgi:hypothetical protein
MFTNLGSAVEMAGDGQSNAFLHPIYQLTHENFFKDDVTVILLLSVSPW